MDDAQWDEVRQWLLKSQKDLEAACVLFESRALLLDIVVYHCQQCAEKALKAYLTYQEVLFPKTHDLEVLLSLCLPLEPSFISLRDMAEDLTPYATAFRYPGDIIAPEQEEAEQALEMAQCFIDSVIAVLPGGILA